MDQGQRDIDAVVNLPRYHHQYLPDKITYEPAALDEMLVSALKARGHELEQRQSPYGDMHAVLWDLINNQLSAASDGRGEGQARLW